MLSGVTLLTPTPHIDAVHALTLLLAKMIVNEHHFVPLRKAAQGTPVSGKP